MCQQVRGLRQSITEYAGGFDARLLTPAQAGEVTRLCAQMEASISSVKARAAARLAEGGTWKAEGYRSVADQLARETGMSPAAAKRALQKGRRLEQQPEVAKAAAEGVLSAEQAAYHLLDRLCRHHHKPKTHHGWALIEGRGKRAFVPPHDPRHPCRAARAGPDPPGNRAS